MEKEKTQGVLPEEAAFTLGSEGCQESAPLLARERGVQSENNTHEDPEVRAAQRLRNGREFHDRIWPNTNWRVPWSQSPRAVSIRCAREILKGFKERKDMVRFFGGGVSVLQGKEGL